MMLAHLALSALLIGEQSTIVGEGSSPQMAVDARGTVRMVFGRKDTILVATSKDGGRTFGAPLTVGVVGGMHLGNTRGPTIASSRSRSVIVAANTAGQLPAFQLDHSRAQWTPIRGAINDVEGSAPEGLATIAANDANAFHTVWLDLREGRKNNIYFSAVPATGARRAPDRALYKSPDGHVCECCRPTIAVSGRHVAVMFRNWLAGARDMYLTTSSDGGKNFSPAQKLGEGSWKLDACPMDGGSLVIGAGGEVASVWRRETTVYYARPGEREIPLGEGRSPMMSRQGSATYVVWEERSTIKLGWPGSAIVTNVGEGRHPQVLALPNGRVVVAWEKDGRVRVQSYDMSPHHSHEGM